MNTNEINIGGFSLTSNELYYCVLRAQMKRPTALEKVISLPKKLKRFKEVVKISLPLIVFGVCVPVKGFPKLQSFTGGPSLY